MPNMKSISCGSKSIAKVKVDNRLTDRQTDKTKKYAPDHSIQGHKKYNFTNNLQVKRRFNTKRSLVEKGGLLDFGVTSPPD